MPTYVYQCENCGTRFEAWQKITDDALTECPTCSGHVRRVLFPVGLVFKGSGFYITDNHANGVVASPSGTEAAAEGGTANGNTPSQPSEGGANKAAATKGGEASAGKAATSEASTKTVAASGAPGE